MCPCPEKALHYDWLVTAFQEQVGSTIECRGLFRARQRILVAVSGGLDSMVLLHVLHSISQQSGWELIVAHLNHQLRGASSLADERFVCRTAKELHLPIVVAQVDVRAFAKERRLSIEMAARELRHEFLARSAVRRRIPVIALAHHLDDQLELFFLRLFRGSGGQGLSGMKWKAPSPSNRNVTLVRPLLNVSKTSLEEYAAERNVPFREDSSNACLDILRNRIRHELLPLLRRKYQPALGDCLSRAMDILAAESGFVTDAAEALLTAADLEATRAGNHLNTKKGERSRFDHAPISARNSVALFESLAVALQRRCVQLQLMRLGISPNYDLVEHLRQFPNRPIELSRELLRGPTTTLADPSRTASGRALRVLREGNRIVCLDRVKTGSFKGGSTEVKVGTAGGCDWDKVRLRWSVQQTRGAELPPRIGGRETFDAEKVGPSAIVRHWRPGDRFQPIGLKESAKLQDLFVNQKVPVEKRRSLLVATTLAGDLFWVEGLRISERFKLTKDTNRRLQWRWQRL
jgi:tRNA(Ile)-lysidine synthase